MYATLFDDPDLINRMLPRYLAVTADEIRDVAAAVFRPDNRVVLTYLPELPPAETASDESTSDARTDDATRRSRHDRRRDATVVAERPDARHAAAVRLPGRRARRGSRTA